MGNLQNKVAVVTGGSRGIGAAIAKKLAAEGASVVVNYAKSADAANQVVLDIQREGGKATAVQADVANDADTQRLIAEAVSTYGHIDILVNNAGVAAFGTLADASAEHTSHQFDINVAGLIATTRHAVPHFPETGGSIVNISSLVAVSPMAGATVYSATKAAVDGFTIGLARELGPKNIRVNAVRPGPVVTDMYAGIAQMEAAMVQRTPLGRIGQPDDIADVVHFLASDASRWVTGQSIGADGGMN